MRYLLIIISIFMLSCQKQQQCKLSGHWQRVQPCQGTSFQYNLEFDENVRIWYDCYNYWDDMYGQYETIPSGVYIDAHILGQHIQREFTLIWNNCDEFRILEEPFKGKYVRQ